MGEIAKMEDTVATSTIFVDLQIDLRSDINGVRPTPSTMHAEIANTKWRR
jgi:hypothetical protein